MDFGSRIRAHCELASSLWLEGDGNGARRELADASRWLERVRQSQSRDGLSVEVLAAQAQLHLRAEDPAQAILRSDEALSKELAPAAIGDHTKAALLDAIVTRASALAMQRPLAPGAAAEAIRDLDTVTADCLGPKADLPGAQNIAGRAINNALLARLRSLEYRADAQNGDAHVQAWLWVGEAKTKLTAAGLGPEQQQAVDRQTVDLALRLGVWDRAWEAVIRSLNMNHRRNERVALLAKAAWLAWEREDLAQARAYGQRALRTSIAVDLPWVRLYAYQGGLIAAAAGSGSIASALRAYRKCTTVKGHLSRPERAWTTAQVALDADHPVADVEQFIRSTLGSGLNVLEGRDLAEMRLAEAAGQYPTTADWHGVDAAALEAPDRARWHLSCARSAIRNSRPSAALDELHQARTCLRFWPGRLREEANRLASRIHDDFHVTASQQRVLDLLVEGMSNAQIAAELGCSARTIAVHMQALLRATGASSRTELAVRELRRRLLDS